MHAVGGALGFFVFVVVAVVIQFVDKKSIAKLAARVYCKTYFLKTDKCLSFKVNFWPHTKIKLKQFVVFL